MHTEGGQELGEDWAFSLSLEMWLVPNEMCCRYKVHTGFQGVSKKRRYNISLIIFMLIT